MHQATSLRTSGVKTLEFAGLFGTAEAVPSLEQFLGWLLVRNARCSGPQMEYNPRRHGQAKSEEKREAAAQPQKV